MMAETMRASLVSLAMLPLLGCGVSPSPVADYVNAVELQLHSDGKSALLYVRLKIARSRGCPEFGAPATIDGRAMNPLEFGGYSGGVGVDAPNDPPCGLGVYEIPVARSAERKSCKVRIADETGEIAFTVTDALSEPALEWISASELPPSGDAELRVSPESLSFLDDYERRSVVITGLDPRSDRHFRADGYTSGSRLGFSVPADAPPGMGELYLADSGKLSAPVLECTGATRCTATSQFSETARTPITVLSP